MAPTDISCFFKACLFVVILILVHTIDPRARVCVCVCVCVCVFFLYFISFSPTVIQHFFF